MSTHEQAVHASAEAGAGTQGPPHVHHMSAVTAYQSAKLGMWLFLATEILLFGGLFAGYALYHWMYPVEYHHGSQQLDRIVGFVNTLVLLFSSYTAALAVDAAQHGRNAKVKLYLWITIACGGIFLLIKAYEYSLKIQHGIFPGSTGGEHGAWASVEFIKEFKSFFGFYYCMTALHAFHVILGMGLLYWAVSKAGKNRYSPTYYTPVEVGALYWHLVDLIWIYLFPLLYLVG